MDNNKRSIVHTLFINSIAGLLFITHGSYASTCDTPIANQAAVATFLQNACYLQAWQHDPAPRLTGGVAPDGTHYSRHGRIQVYYSPAMVSWMLANRSNPNTPLAASTPAIPNGAAMVAVVYPATGSSSQPAGWLAMVRSLPSAGNPNAPADGWFWSQVLANPQATAWPGSVLARNQSQNGFSLCSACHASAVNNLTFANATNLSKTPATQRYTPNFQQPQTDTLQAAIDPPAREKLRSPLGDKASLAFVNWFNQHVPEFSNTPLPGPKKLPVSGIIKFPSQAWDHHYLTATAAGSQASGSFITSDQCQGCHDATALLSKTLPEGHPDTSTNYAPANMGFLFNPQSPADPAGITNNAADVFNISQFGEWSVSLMALAARDPVFHAQAETERVLHQSVEPSVIDNVCYRCHGPMGQRQFHIDQGGDPTQVPYHAQTKPPYSQEYDFSHFMIYATPDSKPGEYPPYNKPGAQAKYAKYGALARNGLSCVLCHTIGPKADKKFDPDKPTDWSTFYGYPVPGFADLEDPKGFDYPITSNFQYDLKALTAPPADDNAGYIGSGQKTVSATEPTQANVWSHKESLKTATVERDYLPKTEICSSCHVVIVPKLAQNYPIIRNSTQIDQTTGKIITGSDGKPIPAKLPNGEDCGPPPTAYGSKLLDPTLDPCVHVSYEQTTFFEWAASSSFGGAQPQTSCTFCHMPAAQGQKLAIANIETSGIGDSKTGAFPAVPYRADDAVRLSDNNGYARHRLMGINLFVHEMFQQFPEILGLTDIDGNTPNRDEYVTQNTIKNLLNAEQSILTHAPTTVALNICIPGQADTPCDSVKAEAGQLKFNVVVNNYAGHRFPTGAGFRRGFLEVRVKDAAGKTLWVSGSVDEYGGILDGSSKQLLATEFPPIKVRYADQPDMLEPHYGSKAAPYLSKQDQVQIYETRATDEFGRLTTSTIRLFGDAKDNRIPPVGWIPPVQCGEELHGLASTFKGAATWCEGNGNGPCPEVNGLSIARLSDITAPDENAFTDPDYCQANPPDIEGNNVGIAGVDHVPYRIPLADITGTPARIEVTMHYQTIPPYFLRDRFLDGQEFARRSKEGGVAGLGSATERLLYISSRLNMTIPNSIPQQSNLPPLASSNWTMHIGNAHIDLEIPPPCPYCQKSVIPAVGQPSKHPPDTSQVSSKHTKLAVQENP